MFNWIEYTIVTIDEWCLVLKKKKKTFLALHMLFTSSEISLKFFVQIKFAKIKKVYCAIDKILFLQPWDWVLTQNWGLYRSIAEECGLGILLRYLLYYLLTIVNIWKVYTDISAPSTNYLFETKRTIWRYALIFILTCYTISFFTVFTDFTASIWKSKSMQRYLDMPYKKWL